MNSHHPVRVFVPRETAALSMGADAVAAAIDSTASASNQSVEIIRNGSRGLSYLEPLIEIEVNGERLAYGPITERDVASLFAAGFLSGGAHALGLGPTESIPYLSNQTRWTFRRIGLGTPLCLDNYRSHGGFTGIERALEIGRQATLDEVMQSGLRGRGGAGFPTGIKWQTVSNATGAQKYIACNADEGDSGTYSDRLLMESDPYCLIEGMLIAGYATGANKGYIYLRSEYPFARRVLTQALQRSRDAGWLGCKLSGSKFQFDIDLHIGAGSYVCGEETAMLESLEGKAGLVRVKPPLPALEGLFGKPTVVNNVVTLGSVPDILATGAEAYASYGVNRSRGTLAFQLSGNVKRGGLVEVPFGHSLRELIDDWGGGTASGKPVRAVQIGGPLGAYFPESLLDTALDYETLGEAGGMLGHGGIVVFDEHVDMAQQARFAMQFCALESCGKCTPCRIGSVRGVEVIDHLLSGRNPEGDRALLDDLCQTMEQGSLCAMGGLTPYPVRSAIKHFPEDFEPRKGVLQ